MTTSRVELRVESVAADEGLIWSLTDGAGRLAGSAAASFWDPISAVDVATAEIELWVAAGADRDAGWAVLLDSVLGAMTLLEVDRVVTRCAPADTDRLRRLLDAGFVVAAVEPGGTMRLVFDR
jgi:hypothetical protein